MGSRKVPVSGHVRGGDIAVVAHERAIETADGADAQKVDRVALRGGLDGLADDAVVPVVPKGFRMVAGVIFKEVERPHLFYGDEDDGDYPTVEQVGVSFAGQDLAGLDFSGLDLSGVDFTGANLKGTNFWEATLHNAVFTDTDLTHLSFSRCCGNGTVFNGAVMSGTAFDSARLVDIYMDGVKIGEETIDLTDATFEIRTLTVVPGLENSYFNETILAGVNWDGVKFKSDALSGVGALSRSSMNGANLDLQSFGEVLLEDVSMRNVSAVSAYLGSTQLRDVDATGGNFTDAFFSDSMVSDSVFDDAVLVGSDWENAAVDETSFRRADMTGARVVSAVLQECDLQDANLTGAVVNYSNFASLWCSDNTGNPNDALDVPGCNLGGVKWDDVEMLDTIFATAYPVEVSPDGGYCRATYDRLSPLQVQESRGIDVEELGVLVWAGGVEARDDKTQRVIDGKFDMSSLHIPVWAVKDLGDVS